VRLEEEKPSWKGLPQQSRFEMFIGSLKAMRAEKRALIVEILRKKLDKTWRMMIQKAKLPHKRNKYNQQPQASFLLCSYHPLKSTHLLRMNKEEELEG
jgi:hypothetical protein